jgi:hypothetical protein
MSIPAQQPARTPIPAQLSDNEFTAFMGPVYWDTVEKCLPVPQDVHGKPVLHYTTVSRAFAKWADDGSLWQACLASVQHLAAAKHLDTRVLHDDGTNTVAKKGGMASGIQDTNTR